MGRMATILGSVDNFTTPFSDGKHTTSNKEQGTLNFSSAALLKDKLMTTLGVLWILIGEPRAGFPRLPCDRGMTGR
jgi:hypothetical protein